VLWRQRFSRLGLPGIIRDPEQPGRKKAISKEQITEVVQLTLHSKPEPQTHLALRFRQIHSMARFSRSTALRAFAIGGTAARLSSGASSGQQENVHQAGLDMPERLSGGEERGIHVIDRPSLEMGEFDPVQGSSRGL
jgi:hypothetical protein